MLINYVAIYDGVSEIKPPIGTCWTVATFGQCRNLGERVLPSVTELFLITKAGHTADIVFGDRMYKIVYFAPAWADMGTGKLAQMLKREVYSKHGVPRFIVPDRDACFASAFSSSKAVLCWVSSKVSQHITPEGMYRLRGQIAWRHSLLKVIRMSAIQAVELLLTMHGMLQLTTPHSS